MNEFRDRLFICGREELQRSRASELTHWISIANPGASCPKPATFAGEHLQLWFGDVISEADAQQCRTKAPTNDDVQQALEFFGAACLSPDSKILFSCDYGASRSPALTYVCLADQFEAGRESDAFDLVLKIRPNAVPNKLVVQLGDFAPWPKRSPTCTLAVAILENKRGNLEAGRAVNITGSRDL